MTGLAGIAIDLFARMLDEGMKRKEESELDLCKQTLRAYKRQMVSLRKEFTDYKEYSIHLITDFEHTLAETRKQMISLTETKNDLLARLSAAYVKETTGGVVSLEEYDKAMEEDKKDAGE